jgi:acyl carrier protein
MDQASAEERLRRLIVGLITLDEPVAGSNASFEEDLSADSLAVVELIMSLEEEFGIDMSDDDWLQGAGVPRRGPRPAGSGAAEVPLPGDSEAG